MSPRTPPWAREEGPGLHDRLLAREQAKVRLERLQTREVAALPLDPEMARRELSDEQRALRMPSRAGRRSKAVAQFDEQVDAIQARQEELRTEAAVLHARLPAAAWANVAAALRADAEALSGGAVADASADEQLDPHLQPIWEDTPEGKRAIQLANERVKAGLAPRNVHKAGWE